MRFFYEITDNGLGLGEVGAFKVQMFNKPPMLIVVQMLNLALLPPFCQTLVSGSLFSSSVSFSIFFEVV